MNSTPSAPPRTPLDPTRGALAVGLLACAGALIATSRACRVQEARLAAPLAQLATGHRALSLSHQPMLMAGLGTSWASVLEVTAMCSAAVLFVPVLVMAALLAPAKQIRPARLLAAILVSAAAILATNTTRIVVIAASMEHWGPGRGYVLAHDTLGTLISLIGVGIALLLFVRITVGRIPRPLGSGRTTAPRGRRRRSSQG